MYSGQLGIPYASRSYYNTKIKMNPQAGGHMDFYLSGDMFRNMYLNPQNDGFFIDSKTDYAMKLQSDYPKMWIYSNETKQTLTQEIINNGFKDYLI